MTNRQVTSQQCAQSRTWLAKGRRFTEVLFGQTGIDKFNFTFEEIGVKYSEDPLF